MLQKIFITLLSLIGISSLLSAKIEYEIHDIGTLQTRSSRAIALNNNGQILGWYNLEKTDSGKQFFVRDKDGVFYELPGKEMTLGLSINWQFLTDDGKAYGTFDTNSATRALCMWDQQNGFVKLGVLPGKDIAAINNSGQVLIKSIDEIENGKSIKRPVIWQNGQITKLYGLCGDLGIESEESFGFDMNNKGEVVGQSIVYLSYKNEIYKQVHATKWIDGYVIDLHMKNSEKSLWSCASLINNLGEVYIKCEQPYFLDRNERVIKMPYDLSFHSNYLYNDRYIFKTDGTKLMHIGNINEKLRYDMNSIWSKIDQIICLNESHQIIAKGITIYGEEHAVLLVPRVKTSEPEKIEPTFEKTHEVVDNEFQKEKIEDSIKNYIDAVFLYHTDGIDLKVRLRFLDSYGEKGGAHVSEPYRKLLMIEAFKDVIAEVETLSESLGCENDIWFWEIVQLRLLEKSPDWKKSVVAYIKIKTQLLK